jgi:predicted permease
MTSISVVLTLAFGIGAVAAMFALVSRMLLQPPPHVSEPERVKRLFFHHEEPEAPRLTHPMWYACVHDRLRSEATTPEHVAAYAAFDVSVAAGIEAASARAIAVSSGFWQALGTRPAIGRFFADEEARPVGGPRVAILGHAFWQQRYGGDPAAIGRTLRVRGELFEIVGVTPRGFHGVELQDVDLWLPLSAYPLSGRSWENDTFLTHIVRLKPGVTTAQADADLSRTVSDVVDEDAGCERPATTPASRLSVSARPLTGGAGGNMQLSGEGRLAVWLVGVAVLLLGVACANVAGLLLVRALGRRREMAVRLALGMNRRRLATQLFIESAMLSTLGGAGAVVVLVWGGAWINHVLLPNLAWEPRVTMDPTMFVLIAACVLGTGFLAGLAPFLQARGVSLLALQDGAGAATTRRTRLHRTLLVAQVAVSVVLLSGAGLFLRSLHNVRSLDLGLDTDRVLVATVDFVGAGRSPGEVGAFYERALERVQSIPGVERAGLATHVPLRSARAGSIRVPGTAKSLAGPRGEAPGLNYVTPGFLATTGTRILEGRDFLPHERDGGRYVIVNEAMARAGWGERSPVGECVGVDGGGACATVVGVVENARKFFITEPATMLLYRPLPRNDGGGARALFVRLEADDRTTRVAVTRAIQAMEPNLPFVRVQRLGDALDPQIRPWRLGASVFTAFGVFAGLLASLGLYGALSYAVTQRTREIGVRLAVGARTSDIVRLVIRDGLGLVLTGILLGMAINVFAGRWIADLLFEVSPRDPAVFTAVGALILGAGLLAAVIPSRRAMSVDPIEALRAQ